MKKAGKEVKTLDHALQNLRELIVHFDLWRNNLQFIHDTLTDKEIWTHDETLMLPLFSESSGITPDDMELIMFWMNYVGIKNIERKGSSELKFTRF